jgi:NAD(P)H-hydrate epimerase
MNSAISSYWSRQVDQRAIHDYGMSGLVMMENAGRGCADLLEQIGIAGPVVICCGKGNNAGDGFVIARHLELRGYSVKVLLWFPPESLRGDAAHNCQILQRAETPLLVCPDNADREWLPTAVAGADWIVDAILGTGSTGVPRPPFDSVIDELNRHCGKKFAVDLPSGLDCDTGQPSQHTFRADHTATFVASKQGFKAPSAAAWLGDVHVVDIGAPQKLVREILRLGGDPDSGDSVS